ncbi:MAG: ABC transporter ATP-binding protein [Archaeoglobaceae archaeon]|uniref:ABC transporter ATP-binding protein n=1 Tax=Archaeoglobus fulgidus TaxID=2234 RepID=A0A7J3M5Y9_ARCFL
MMALEGIEVWYGKIMAVSEISFEVNKGEIVGLIGPNGAGKTTILNTIIGVVKPRKGEIFFENEKIKDLQTHEIIKKGIAIAPEGRKLFPFLTVEENLLMGAINGDAWKKKSETLKFVYSLFPRLSERRAQLAGTLSGGEQQMLTIGRALMSKPKLLLVDEPSLGLAPKVALEIYRLLQKLREEGVTILLSDQNAKRVFEISDRAYVVENGRIVMHGESSELEKDERIRKVYLGL